MKTRPPDLISSRAVRRRSLITSAQQTRHRATWPWWSAAVAVLLAAIPSPAWINYGEGPPEKTPEYGKEYRGFSLVAHTREQEFEQDSGQPLTVVLRNTTSQTTVAPDGTDGPRYAYLYVVLATANRTTMFSQNLLADPANALAKGTVAAQGETPLAVPGFDELTFYRVTEQENGLPVLPERGQPATELVPQSFYLKAVLLAGPEGERPDFSLASELWPVLLRPKSGDRMDAAEKQARLGRYLKKLDEGAYGGMAVSSQLAALGEAGVDALIKRADREGEGTTRESRIWAIVTLCNCGSPRATEYIHRRLSDPISLGDLAFLAWHSQGCRSDAVRQTLRDLALKAASNQPLPWQKRFPDLPQGIRTTFLEFTFKHFYSTHLKISDELLRACLQQEDPKTAGLALMVWKPASPAAAVELLKPLFAREDVHPKLKEQALKRLRESFAGANFPVRAEEADWNAAWERAREWLQAKKMLAP